MVIEKILKNRGQQSCNPESFSKILFAGKRIIFAETEANRGDFYLFQPVNIIKVENPVENVKKSDIMLFFGSVWNNYGNSLYIFTPDLCPN